MNLTLGFKGRIKFDVTGYRTNILRVFVEGLPPDSCRAEIWCSNLTNNNFRSKSTRDYMLDLRTSNFQGKQSPATTRDRNTPLFLSFTDKFSSAHEVPIWILPRQWSLRWARSNERPYIYRAKPTFFSQRRAYARLYKRHKERTAN